MKTTIDLLDEIFHKVKILAAEGRTPLKDLIILDANLHIYASSSAAEDSLKRHFVVE